MTVSRGQFQDYYEILRVSRHATDEQIKKRYYNWCRVLHSDRTDGELGGDEYLKEITNAYNELKDSEKRARYNLEWDYHQREQTRSTSTRTTPPPGEEPKSPPREEAPREEPKAEPKPPPREASEPPPREEFRDVPPETQAVYEGKKPVSTKRHSQSVSVLLGVGQGALKATRAVNSWLERGKYAPINENFSCALRWFLYSFVMIPQTIFGLPILIVMANMPSNEEGKFGGSYLLATFVAAPIARFISTFVPYARKRKVVFALAFYPIVVTIQLAVFYGAFR
jgi:curved DNA-binding protein CbpA